MKEILKAVWKENTVTLVLDNCTKRIGLEKFTDRDLELLRSGKRICLVNSRGIERIELYKDTV